MDLQRLADCVYEVFQSLFERERDVQCMTQFPQKMLVFVSRLEEEAANEPLLPVLNRLEEKDEQGKEGGFDNHWPESTADMLELFGDAANAEQVHGEDNAR